MKKRTINIPTPPQRRGRRHLVVRELLAGLAWLDAPLSWFAGRPAWQTRAGFFQPTANDLAQATYRIERLVRAGLPAERIARLRHTLAEAIYFASLPVVDLPDLAFRSRQRDVAAFQTLVALLPVEARCTDQLAPSPAALLAASGPGALHYLRVLLADPQVPADGCALAALVCGVIERKARREAEAYRVPTAYQAAYLLGYRHGLPADLFITIRLLAVPGGPALAERYVVAWAQRSPFQFSNEAARELFLTGVPAERFVASIESLAAAAPLIDQALATQNELNLQPTRKQLRTLSTRHQRLIAVLVETLRSYVKASGPDVVQPFKQVVLHLLNFGMLIPALLDHLESVLRMGLTPNPKIGHDFLTLLASEYELVWDRRELVEPVRPDAFGKWLHERHWQMVRPICDLLKKVADPVIVREALRRNCLRSFVRSNLRRPTHYWLVFRLLDHFSNYEEYISAQLVNLLLRLPTTSGEQLVQRLVESLLIAPPSQRSLVFDILVSGITIRQTDGTNMFSQAELNDVLPHLIQNASDYLPLASDDQLYCAEYAVSGTLLLTKRNPALAIAALAWLIKLLPQLNGYESRVVYVAIHFAARLADDLPGFQAIVEALLKRERLRTIDYIDKGLAQVRAMAGLNAALRYLAPQQPNRSLHLVERIGMATTFGPGALAALALIEAPPADQFDAPALVTAAAGWRELLALAPGSASDAAIYLQACWLLGRDPALPGGVRQALEQPLTMAREVAYLRKLVLEQPQKRGLSVRLANLEARLADDQALWAAAAAEASERLAQITAETQFAAAESLLNEIFRRRLAAVAGPLPSGLVFDDNLCNAILLLSDIDSNKGLLRRMLRAIMQGEQHWREQLPGNIAFLNELQARGVDTARWLSEAVTLVEQPEIPGGQVRIAFESDPLHVLQMGNYFGTCLSLGGGNAFSTVANAVALNRRVLYVRDRHHRVIGRKLIAISSEGKLLGFRLYSPFAKDEYGFLSALVDTYIREFARSCGLELADTGSVPNIIQEQWYDDGEVAWGVEVVTPRKVA